MVQLLQFLWHLSPYRRYLSGISQSQQGVHRSLNHIMGVRSPQGLRQHVLDACRLNHRAYRPTGYHARPLGSGLQEDLARAIFS